MSTESVNPNNHSLSLAVKDIHASKAFYEKLGFTPVEGTGPIEHNWIIMENGHSKIGLFQGMFDENIITFNPTDARSEYKKLKEDDNVKFLMESESLQEEKGPCHFCIEDPDGNQILFDQHNE
ncbi:MAG: VOC family protein [Balneola sp.]|nr:VOC family protein [Balneola sp.]MBO6649968.1 VOC family protein [Balneola sp.]MBO6711682.1 VOC family protein [Balneola sp.]MBO6799878.1 VOC family protein [Balneola sp.]MBO6871121.1 VOC family protein [Balneola sp.]